jgi:hypothetical protein
MVKLGYYKLNCVSPPPTNFYVRVLTPVTQSMAIFRDKALKEINMLVSKHA